MDHRDAAALGRADRMKEDHDRMVLIDNNWCPDHDCTGDDNCQECKEEGYLGELPARYEVCHTCDGRGKHVNPSIDAHGISPEEFDEDPSFHEDYMRGTFDVTCYGCGGRRVSLVVDESQLDADTLRRYLDRINDEVRYRAEVEAERRMGC